MTSAHPACSTADAQPELSILIVDDVAANRLALRLLLRGPGRRILEASSGTDALRILLNEEVGVILLDIEMPDMDGFETADLIRGSSRLRDVPIIFQSAHGSNSRVIRGYGMGAVDFIQKPIIPEILQARVDVFLQLHQKTKELERTHAQLAQSEARSRTILETATDGVIAFDDRGVIQMFNPAAERMFGYTADELISSSAAAILQHPETAEPLVSETDASLDDLAGVTHDVLGLRRDGTTFPIGVSVSRVDVDGVHFYSATVRDLTEMKKVEQRLTRLAQHDYLTGLANRVTLEDRVAQALTQTHQFEGEGNGALLFIDLDRFKQVNDQHGHRIGDLLLVAASRRLERVLRDSDVLARLGGDEFCVLVEHVTNPDAVTAIGERVVEALREPFQLDGVTVEISASVGIAEFRPQHDTVADVTLRADRAMYAAKRLGGDQFSHPDDDPEAGRAEPTFVEEVMHGLRSDAFVLHYQPIVSLPGGHTMEVEALLRWNRPGAGLSTPKSFMRAAETSGMIIPIGRWMIRKALEHAAAMPPAPQPPGITINLSAAELADESLPDYVSLQIDTFAVDPRRIVFEVSESAFFSGWSETQQTIDRLRSLGARIALDQFGLGHASLAALTEVECDIVKLDRSLIVSLDGGSSQRRSVVASIISVAHEFCRTVVANGVERAAQRDVLIELGCDQAQGMLFAEPAPADVPGVWLWRPGAPAASVLVPSQQSHSAAEISDQAPA